MRVLEAGSVHTYKMGKNRKHRIRKTKENEAEDSSDDGTASVCSHITKAVNFAAMRKMLLKPTVTFGECSGCTTDASRSGARDLFGSPLEGAAAAAVEDSDYEPTIWVCLQCGHQGCDRNSREKHALKHYETPHSGMHCICANLTTWSAWCYACDNDIPLESCKRIQECVEFLRKQAGLPRMELAGISAQRPPQTASQSDLSPTDHSPTGTQPRADKAQIGGKSPAVVCQKVKGLSNLGNTCFFNAVMQNLCQTHSLESLLVSSCKKGRPLTLPGHDQQSDSDSSAEGEDEDDSKEKLKELAAVEIVCGDPGPLTQALLYFVQEMNNGTTHGTVNPNALFSHVCKKAPRFKGFQQQDSHELLRYLLDVVRNEEIKRAQSGILKYFKLSESINPKKVDDDTKLKVKEYGRRVKFTFLDSLFGGQLVSTVLCEECKHISQIFEPFLDLSLPVTEEKPQRPNQMLGGKRKDCVAAAASEVHEDTTPATGVDGFAERPDKPSKYQERKNRRQAKKEAKKKGKTTGRKGSTSQPAKGATGGEEGEDEEEGEEKGAEGGEEEQEEEAGSKAEGQEAPASSRGSIDNDDDNSSLQDDPSDADVEDNLESDISRLNTSMTNHFDSPSNPANASANGPTSLTSLRVSSSNLNNCLSNGNDIKPSSVDTEIKSETVKENHILPRNWTEQEDSGAASENLRCGIKDEKSKSGIEKLANGISNIEFGSEGEQKEEERKGYAGGHAGSQGEQKGAPGMPKPPQFESRLTNHVGNGDAGSVPLLDRGDDKYSLSSTNKDGQDHTVYQSLAPATHKDGQEHTDTAIYPSSPMPPSTLSSGGRYGIERVQEVEPCAMETSQSAERNAGETGLEKDIEDKLTIGSEAGGDADKKAMHNHLDKDKTRDLKREARYKSQATLAPRYQPAPKECSVMSCLHQFTAAELLTGSNKVGCKNCTRIKPKNATPHKDKKGSDMVYSNASKQFLILVPPAVLTLHLKRFEQVGFTSRKVNRHVEFPTILDIAPYCSSLCHGVKPGQRKVLYSLYGVVEHSGRLSGGHYTAYVKVRPSLGPLTSFLHTTQPNPRDFINRYLEQVQKAANPAEEEALDDGSPEALVPPGRWFHISDSRINEVTEALVLKAQAYLLFYERIC